MTDTSKIPFNRLSNITFESNKHLEDNNGEIIINDASITTYFLNVDTSTTISISSQINLPNNISFSFIVEINKTSSTADITLPNNDNFKWIDNYVPGCGDVGTYLFGFKTHDNVNWICSYQGMINNEFTNNL